MNFDDSHRYILQYILKHGSVQTEIALKYLETVTEGNSNDIEALHTIIQEINNEITKQGFSLKLQKCEITGKQFLVWTNMKSDQFSQMHTFTESELEYFKSVFMEILKSEHKSFDYMRCLNLTSTLTGKLSRENGQKCLLKWIKTGYFVQEGNNVYFGPRTLVEFKEYIKEHDDTSVCPLCTELVIKGKTCAQCENVFHSYCIQRLLKSHSSCPNCEKEWQEKSFNL